MIFRGVTFSFSLQVTQVIIWLEKGEQAMECEADRMPCVKWPSSIKSNYSLFTKKTGDIVVVVLVYVDDMAIASNNILCYLSM